jgi:hypothetical protein
MIITPPLAPAVLPLKVQFVQLMDVPELEMTPPLLVAVHPLNSQSIAVKAPLTWIAPAEVDVMFRMATR